MPPRIAAGHGSSRSRGSSRATASNRGGLSVGLPSIAASITGVGVRRPGYGEGGTKISVTVNAYSVEVPDVSLYHYDVILPELPNSSLRLKVIHTLQTKIASVFHRGGKIDALKNWRPAVYDGKKNMYTSYELELGRSNAGEFDVSLSDSPQAATTGRPPKVYRVRLTQVRKINLEVLRRYCDGQQALDNEVLTGLTSLNIILRMATIMQDLPFNSRSVFTSKGAKGIGGGFELWRGYFQSVRPALGRMIVNIDISTGLMFKGGPLIPLCLEFLGLPPNDPRALLRMSDSQHRRLQQFLAGVRVRMEHSGRTETIKRLSKDSARKRLFTLRDGTVMSVEKYFQSSRNKKLQYPDLICVEVGREACLPLEVCEVPRGQLAKKQIPQEKVNDVLKFTTSEPSARLASIVEGVEILAHDKSPYMAEFNLTVQTENGPLKTDARVLNPPPLTYGTGKQPKITPRDGKWNMIDKHFYRPATIRYWAIIIYEGTNRFSHKFVAEMVKNIIKNCRMFGMTVIDEDPLVKYENGQGKIDDHLRNAGLAVKASNKELPNLLFVVLPDGAGEIYTKVKHFGDIKTGVATQCLKAMKCKGANDQYWANVLLKVNVKLGGINVILDPAARAVIGDPNSPTIVMGADVMDAPPGASDRPSYAALVSSVDNDAAQYIASTRVQPIRQQIIEDLYDMCKHALQEFKSYGLARVNRTKPPARIIFYRDGVSEGEYQQVLDQELPQLKRACEELGMNPKITFIVVGKRHHIRFVPQPRDQDKSKNCPAGTIVDRDISHPTDFDFYLQSHAGLKGTSRPAHYYVLYDDNKFSADALQTLSYALCHVYARCTRAVSIPAPVYYADIVCSRAKNHFDPSGRYGQEFSDAGTHSTSDPNSVLESYKHDFMPLSQVQARRMYFM